MREGGSDLANSLRNDGSAGDGADASLSMLDSTYFHMKSFVPPKETAAQALSREITEHKRQVDEQSYLERGLSFITEPIHGSGASLARMTELEEKARKGSSPELDREISAAIKTDNSALKLQSEIGMYGSGMVQTAGLFLGGKKGLAYTAVAFGAGTAKPSDSGLTQVADFSLGATKGVATRAVFQGVMRSSTDVATKALAMGTGSRLTDSLLSRHTYLNPQTGGVDVAGGLGRTVQRTFDPTYMATDLVVFGTGQALLQNQAVKGMVQKNAMRATMTAAGSFGFASGSADEISKQWRDGTFDPSAIVARGLLRGGTDAIASIPGGLQATRLQARNSGAELGLHRNEGAVLKAEPTQLAQALRGEQALRGGQAVREGQLIRDNISNAKPTIPGSSSREFQIVGGDTKALDLLSKSKTAAAVLDVREVSPAGKPVGDTKKLLVQHVDASTPLRSRLASTVDLIASCNPGLCGPSGAKHLFGDMRGTSSVFFSRLADRLSFNTDRAALATRGGAPVELGSRTVSELLLLPETKNLLRTPRPVESYAKEMRHFKDPARRVVDAGADSIVFELADGRILKMTDRPYRKDGQPLWRPEWGTRTYETESGIHRFDARLLTKPVQIDVKGEPVMYYIQERAQTPVTTQTLLRFHDNINRDGNYVFWDGGVSSLGHAQLGYVPTGKGGRGVVLLDYDAVRRPSDIPPETQLSPGSDNHWMSRYRADRVEWER